MKVSELIEKLQKLKAEVGDLDVFFECTADIDHDDDEICINEPVTVAMTMTDFDEDKIVGILLSDGSHSEI